MKNQMTFQEAQAKNERIAELFEQRQRFARTGKTRSLTTDEHTAMIAATNEYFALCSELEKYFNS